MESHVLRPEDHPALVALFEAAARPADAEAVREGRGGPSDGDRTRLVWMVGDVGCLRLTRNREDTVGHFGLDLLVRPDARGRGVGRALWDVALAQGPARLRTQTRDDDPASLAFAKRRGFVVQSHLFESVLDLEGFDPAPFAVPEGLRVFSMADVPDDETHRRRLWRLNDWDIDAGAGACRSFERFERDVFGGYWYRPEGQIVAAYGDEWVGLAAVGMTGAGKGYNMMTGVVPAFRRRGIATALKLATIEWTRRAGAREIWTNNDSENVGMLAINRRLGYRPVPGWYRLAADVGSCGPDGRTVCLFRYEVNAVVDVESRAPFQPDRVAGGVMIATFVAIEGYHLYQDTVLGAPLPSGGRLTFPLTAIGVVEILLGLAFRSWLALGVSRGRGWALVASGLISAQSLAGFANRPPQAWAWHHGVVIAFDALLLVYGGLRLAGVLGPKVSALPKTDD